MNSSHLNFADIHNLSNLSLVAVETKPMQFCWISELGVII